MASGRYRITALCFGAVFIYWIFTGCAYHHLPHQPAVEETPLPIVTKPEVAATEQKAPAGPGPEADAVVPEIYALEIPSQIPSTSGFYSHKVRWPNETLYLIAKWYTGNARNWKAIATANPELDPKKIAIGDRIAIPEDLLITRTPLPFSFGRSLVRKKVKPPVPPDKISVPAEPPKLFGPIESDKAESFAPTVTKSPSRKSRTVKLFGPVE
jgi:hypothetical protein